MASGVGVTRWVLAHIRQEGVVEILHTYSTPLLINTVQVQNVGVLHFVLNPSHIHHHTIVESYPLNISVSVIISCSSIEILISSILS